MLLLGQVFFYRYENVFTNYIEVIIITMYSMYIVRNFVTF